MAEALAGNRVRAEDILDTVEAIAPTAYTPSITGLTKGTGWTQEGWWSQVGPMCVAHYMITLGTSPAYTGSLAIDLPPGMTPLITTTDHAIGSWIVRDDSLTDWYTGTVGYLTSTTCRLLGVWNGTIPVNAVGQTVSGSPTAAGAGDRIAFQLAYLLA